LRIGQLEICRTPCTLIATAKNSYDTTASAVRTYGAELALLNETLRDHLTKETQEVVQRSRPRRSGTRPPIALRGALMPKPTKIALQGVGASAEQAGAAVLMAEYAPRERRWFFAALPFTGIMAGTVAAAVIYFVMLLGVDNIANTWLWRVPFLLSVFIIAVAIWIRLKLKESPEFTKLEARHQVADRP